MVGISEGALKGDNPHEKSKECFRKGFSISLGKNKSEADLIKVPATTRRERFWRPKANTKKQTAKNKFQTKLKADPLKVQATTRGRGSLEA